MADDEVRSFRDKLLTSLCPLYVVDLEVRERFMMLVNCSECWDARVRVHENNGHSWPRRVPIGTQKLQRRHYNVGKGQ